MAVLKKRVKDGGWYIKQPAFDLGFITYQLNYYGEKELTQRGLLYEDAHLDNTLISFLRERGYIYTHGEGIGEIIIESPEEYERYKKRFNPYYSLKISNDEKILSLNIGVTKQGILLDNSNFTTSFYFNKTLDGDQNLFTKEGLFSINSFKAQIKNDEGLDYISVMDNYEFQLNQLDEALISLPWYINKTGSPLEVFRIERRREYLIFDHNGKEKSSDYLNFEYNKEVYIVPLSENMWNKVNSRFKHKNVNKNNNIPIYLLNQEDITQIYDLSKEIYFEKYPVEINFITLKNEYEKRFSGYVFSRKREKIVIEIKYEESRRPEVVLLKDFKEKKLELVNKNLVFVDLDSNGRYQIKAGRYHREFAVVPELEITDSEFEIRIKNKSDYYLDLIFEDKEIDFITITKNIYEYKPKITKEISATIRFGNINSSFIEQFKRKIVFNCQSKVVGYKNNMKELINNNETIEADFLKSGFIDFKDYEHNEYKIIMSAYPNRFKYPLHVSIPINQKRFYLSCLSNELIESYDNIFITVKDNENEYLKFNIKNEKNKLRITDKTLGFEMKEELFNENIEYGFKIFDILHQDIKPKIIEKEELIISEDLLKGIWMIYGVSRVKENDNPFQKSKWRLMSRGEKVEVIDGLDIDVLTNLEKCFLELDPKSEDSFHRLNLELWSYYFNENKAGHLINIIENIYREAVIEDFLITSIFPEIHPFLCSWWLLAKIKINGSYISFGREISHIEYHNNKNIFLNHFRFSVELITLEDIQMLYKNGLIGEKTYDIFYFGDNQEYYYSDCGNLFWLLYSWARIQGLNYENIEITNYYQERVNKIKDQVDYKINDNYIVELKKEIEQISAKEWGWIDDIKKDYESLLLGIIDEYYEIDKSEVIISNEITIICNVLCFEVICHQLLIPFNEQFNSSLRAYLIKFFKQRSQDAFDFWYFFWLKKVLDVKEKSIKKKIENAYLEESIKKIEEIKNIPEYYKNIELMLRLVELYTEAGKNNSAKNIIQSLEKKNRSEISNNLQYKNLCKRLQIGNYAKKTEYINLEQLKKQYYGVSGDINIYEVNYKNKIYNLKYGEKDILEQIASELTIGGLKSLTILLTRAKNWDLSFHYIKRIEERVDNLNSIVEYFDFLKILISEYEYIGRICNSVLQIMEYCIEKKESDLTEIHSEIFKSMRKNINLKNK